MASNGARRTEALLGRWAGLTGGARAFGRGIRFVTALLVEAAPRLAAAMLVLTLIQSTLPVLNVRLTQLIVNTLAGKEAASRLLPLVLTYLALLVAAAGLAPALNMLQAVLTERLMGQVTLRILSKINTFTDLSRFEDPALYNELQTIGERAHHLPRLLLRSVTTLAEALLPATGLCLLLATLHPLVPLVLLAATLPGLLVQRRHATLRWNQQQETAELERRQEYWLEVGTSAASAREVQLFGVAGWVRDQFAECLEELNRRRWRLRRHILWQTFATLGLRFAGTAAVFVYLVLRGASGRLRPGDVVLFLGSLLLLDGHLRFIPLWVGRIIEEAYLADRFLAFLQSEGPMPGGHDRLPPSGLRQGVEFQHVSFRYPGREEVVLQDVTFAIRPGETVALVGRNGAGKTTLVKLLTGLYQPASGSIRCGGQELSDCDPASVRASIAVVFQDYGRYFLTAGENIGLGRVEEITSLERIARAARDGGSEPLIHRLESGYDTRLGKEFGGTQLSGGEWQKLALSRAFMRDADLLILDEPTAALDVRAEAEIYERFHDLLGGRAGLLISHRFSTVRMADRIVVLEAGRIVEEGAHETLMARGGLYAEMFRLQAEAFQPEREGIA
jgi:ATP-binding cassette, subfamily B, bacterial